MAFDDLLAEVACESKNSGEFAAHPRHQQFHVLDRGFRQDAVAEIEDVAEVLESFRG